MQTTNIVTVSYKRSHRSTASPAIWQWDYGQMLRFEGFSLPDLYSVHFANRPLDGEAMVEIGDADGVPIPDALLQTGLPVYAWLYLHSGEEDGETVYMATIPVNKRPQPSDRGLLPEQISTLERAMEALDGAVDAAEDARDEAREAAESVEEAAAAIAGAVRFDTAQGLTDEEKAQARENIGAGTGEGGSGAFYVTLNNYSGETIPDAAPDMHMSIGVFLPQLPDVQHRDVKFIRVTDDWREEVIIDLIGLPEPLLSGWVDVHRDGSVVVTYYDSGDAYTLPEKIVPIFSTDENFTIEAWADDSDLEINPIDYVEYPLDPRTYTRLNAVCVNEQQDFTEGQKAQARVNIAAASQDDFNKAWHMLARYNSVRLFEDVFPADSASPHTTITYTWNGNTECTVRGRSLNFDSKSEPLGDVSPLPAGDVVPGQQLFVKFRSTGDKVRLWIRMITAGTSEYTDLQIDSDTIITVPLSKAGGRFIARLQVPASSTTDIEEEVVTVGIYTAPSNLDLLEMIQDLAARLNG